MSDVLDALGVSLVLLALPWIVVQMGVAAALAARAHLSPWAGAALGLIPIPFVGWLAVTAWARQQGIPEEWAQAPAKTTSSISDHDDDGW